MSELPSSSVRPSAGSVIAMLAGREWTRFFRQRNRVIGGLGQPILFWLLFGTGMHGAFRAGDGSSFMTYFLPGTVALILLFTAIFATISIIEDRREGFLQNVLVAPVPRWTIALGKIFGGAAIAWVQACLFLLLAIATGTMPVTVQLLPLVIMMAIAAMGLTGLGVCFAWPMESTQGFHAIMNLILMPLWLLSGAFFPIPMLSPNAPIGQKVMHWIMCSNPVSYTIAGMRTMMSEGPPSPDMWNPSALLVWSVTIGFAVATCLLATWIIRRPYRGAL
ncbi:MAG: ABC transporter permease [Pirellulales bacterium]